MNGWIWKGGYHFYIYLNRALAWYKEFFLSGADRFSYRGLEASPKRDRKQKQRLLPTHQAQNPPLMPQYSSGSISPNRVAASTNTDQHYVSTVVTDDGKETSRAIPVPPPPTSQTSRARNSVEGFNTEIEKLVCRGHEITSSKVTESIRLLIV